MKNSLKITAVGDISFMGSHADEPSLSVFEPVSPFFSQADLVVGNLEGPLVLEGDPVRGKCVLRGHPDWAKVLRDGGIGLVSLANNHLMDYGASGLYSTMEALEHAGINYVGAGRTLEEAAAPVRVDIHGQQIALLARTAVEVSTPSYAGQDTPGVAFLDENEVLASIQKCAQEVDHIVVLIHWGLEEYRFPSSQQRELAAKMVGAGAKIILGHHPHVIQGEEKIGPALVSYSSGNFLFDEFSWAYITSDGREQTTRSTLSEANREGLMTSVEISADGEISSQQIFSKISPTVRVLPDNDAKRPREYDKLCAGLQLPFYGVLWKLYALKKEWDLRIKPLIFPDNFFVKLKKMRLHHFSDRVKKISRSVKVMLGKSTNPYE